MTRRDEQGRRKAQRTYTIASRCGVFAKSDVQPLINQGARTRTWPRSIYKAVVNQTIAGLAQGRPSRATSSIWAARSPSAACCARALTRRWHVTGTCPENSLLYRGAGRGPLCRQGFCSARWPSAGGVTRTATYARAAALRQQGGVRGVPARHHAHSVPRPLQRRRPGAIGIDFGSTTIKAVVVGRRRCC